MKPPSDFRWNGWNINHIAEHGVEPEEAEYVASRARAPWPRNVGDGKYMVMGQSAAGRHLQVIFVRDEDAPTVYVIHARPLTGPEKRRFKRTVRMP